MFPLSILRFGSSDITKSKNAPEKAVLKGSLSAFPVLSGEMYQSSHDEIWCELPREVECYILSMAATGDSEFSLDEQSMRLHLDKASLP